MLIATDCWLATELIVCNAQVLCGLLSQCCLDFIYIVACMPNQVQTLSLEQCPMQWIPFHANGCWNRTESKLDAMPAAGLHILWAML
jgi:hypothetical protein